MRPSANIELARINAEFFWAKVEKTEGCWLWTGCGHPRGYGMFAVARRKVLAHRVAWVLAHGALPLDGQIVCHRCDNRLCVRPDHLFAAAHKQGEDHPSAKQDEATILDIRRSYAAGEKQRHIAKRLGLDFRYVNSVVRGRIWRHVEAA